MSLYEELGLESPFQDIRHETILSIVRTANLVSARAGQLFRGFGLTEAQFNVLFSLRHSTRNVTQAELGKRLVVTRASVTSVLDKLEDKGLVERQKVAGNRRIYHVRLTLEGAQLMARVEPSYREEVHRALGDLGEDECTMLIDSLEKARGRVRAMLSGESGS